MKRAFRIPFLLLLLFAFVILTVLHLRYLSLPWFWDEIAQVGPTALDLYHGQGPWVRHSFVPNVHPPTLAAVLALVWRIFGYSITAARLTMLTIASLGLVLSFLVATRLTADQRVPAFCTVLFLVAAPVFFTQSMLMMLDMPVMVLTVLTLLLFLDRRYSWCAAACVLLVVTRETSVTTPAVFGLWLWFQENRRQQALYFTAPGIALAIWLLILHLHTGYWLGNVEFSKYNIPNLRDPVLMAMKVFERVRYLFWSDGHFIGTIAIALNCRFLRGRGWAVAGLIAAAQAVLMTVLGSPLVRYLLPVLPILYAAMAAAASFYPAKWKWASCFAMMALLIGGWFWNPPYPFAWENNLSMIRFIRLQQDTARYLESNFPDKRIATAWPLSEELSNPAWGYVRRPLRVVDAGGLRLAYLEALDRQCFDLVVEYKRLQPAAGSILDMPGLRPVLQHYYEYHPQAAAEEIRLTMGLVPLKRWHHRDQWVEIYGPTATNVGARQLTQ